MAKIHITLVGGQATPVYQGIVHANPDRVILIHSHESENEASRMYLEVEVSCELSKFDPVDLSKINESIIKLKKDFLETDEITINLSSGTKMWSLLFYSHFINESHTVLFAIDQNNKVWNLKTYESADVRFDIDVQFRLLGNALKDYSHFDIYNDSDKEVVGKIRELYNFNSKHFSDLAKLLVVGELEYVESENAISTMEWDEEQKQLLVTLTNKRGQRLSKTLQSPQLLSLIRNTSWFEFEVAQLLSRWTACKELRLNCIFPTNDGSPKNEIDIIVNTGSKLLFVECKTRVFNETDVDKFASAVKVYGGLGSKALFVTDAPMTDKAQEKCADHGIMTFCLKQNSYNLPIESSLFKMLDSELYNINLK